MIHGFIVSMIHWIIGSLFHWFTESSVHLSIKNKLIHWLIRSLNHRFIGSSVHWFIKSLNLLVCCFVDLLVHFWIYSRFIDSLTQPFIDSLNHRPTDAWFTVSSSVHWLIGSLVHQLTKFIQIHPNSPIHWSTVHWFIDPLFHSCIDSLVHSVSSAWILSFMSLCWHLHHHFAHSLVHLTTSTVHCFASQKLSYRLLTSYNRFIFYTFRPRHGPGTIL